MKKIADKLIKTGAALFECPGPSGKLSISINSSIIAGDPSLRSFFASALIDLMDKKSLAPDIIVGVDNAGIFFASMIALRSSLPMAYVRAAAKDHGKKNRIEGKINKGDKAVIFIDAVYDDDLIDSAEKALAETGCSVAGVIALFSSVKREHLFSLVTFGDLKKRALKKGYLNKFICDLCAETDREAPDRESLIAENTADILLSIKAVSLSPEEPFRYASGILSPVYCDNRLLISYHKEWMKIINYMIEMIREKIGTDDFDVVGGTATAGIPHGILIADILNKPFVWLKSEVCGQFPRGSRVLIVEDLISSGKSSGNAIDAVRKSGGIVNDCISIFTYEMKKAEQMFDEKKCNNFSLSGFSRLVKTASEKKYIKKEDIEKICEWNRDPEGWGKRYGFEK